MRDVLRLGIVVIAVGCGDTGARGSGGAGGEAAEAGSHEGGEGGGEPSGGGPSRERGHIAVMKSREMTADGPSERWSVGILYGVLDQRPPLAECVPEVIDHCRVFECSEFEFWSPHYMTISAGPVTLTAGNHQETFVPDGVEYKTIDMAGEFVVGGTVEATVAGDGDIPPHVLSAVVPEDINLLAPIIGPPSGPDASVATIDRAEDLLVQWTPGSNGIVEFRLLVHDYYGELYQGVICDADPSAGSMIVPSELLSRMEKSDLETSISFGIYLRSEAETVAGDCQVTLEVSGSVTTSQGYPPGGVLSLL